MVAAKSRPSPDREAAIGRQLDGVERALRALERRMRSRIARTPADRRPSARNLIHYVALRQQDLRDLQSELAQRGLSSLGRSESCVMESLLQVSERMHESLAARGIDCPTLHRARDMRRHGPALSWDDANVALHRHTQEMLGSRPRGRHIYIMVTAPSALEADRAWMTKMLEAGMNVLRINCAHEGGGSAADDRNVSC